MLKLHRKPRDNYLRELADDPLFQAVPKHLLPVIARSVDVLDLAPGSIASCDPTREAVILTRGEALLEDARHRPIGLIGPVRTVGSPGGAQWESRRITAISRVRCVVITRRELPELLRIAPAISKAIQAGEYLPRVTPALKTPTFSRR